MPQFLILLQSLSTGYVGYYMGFSMAPDPDEHRFLGQISYLSLENKPQFLTTGRPLFYCGYASWWYQCDSYLVQQYNYGSSTAVLLLAALFRLSTFWLIFRLVCLLSSFGSFRNGFLGFYRGYVGRFTCYVRTRSVLLHISLVAPCAT